MGGAWAPARNALLADVIPAQAYGRANGFERAMDNLGAILGPLLALAVPFVLAGVGIGAVETAEHTAVARPGRTDRPAAAQPTSRGDHSSLMSS